MSRNAKEPGSVKTHYDQMLGSVYSWIVGDFDVACRDNTSLFASLDLRSDRGADAVDLGCGPGCQTIPLAEAGFNVTAIDFCDELLCELKQHAGTLPVRIVQDDILNFSRHIPDAPDLIVCMGDTLVHLPAMEAVSSLIADVVSALRPGGTFIASLRDYSGPPLTGVDRFIPIRSSSDRIFSCFLEFQGDKIQVHDLLQTRQNGEWQLRVSQYQKLRLDYRFVAQMLGEHGMTVEMPRAAQHAARGLMVIRARKPAGY
jgi:SAM-dependent methyltransferase